MDILLVILVLLQYHHGYNNRDNDIYMKAVYSKSSVVSKTCIWNFGLKGYCLLLNEPELISDVLSGNKKNAIEFYNRGELSENDTLVKLGVIIIKNSTNIPPSIDDIVLENINDTNIASNWYNKIALRDNNVGSAKSFVNSFMVGIDNMVNNHEDMWARTYLTYMENGTTEKTIYAPRLIHYWPSELSNT